MRAGLWKKKKKKKNSMEKLSLLLCLPRKCQESSSTGSCVGQGPRARAHPQRIINPAHRVVRSSQRWGWCWWHWWNGSEDGAGGDSGQHSSSAPQGTHNRGTEEQGGGCHHCLWCLHLGCDAATGSHRSWSYKKQDGKWRSVLQLVREECKVTESQFQGSPPPN